MSFNFLKSFGIFGFFTLISRIFGLARDIINARMLGVNEFSDAFFVAFRLPNLFRSLFAEGAMNSAFIPIYAKKLARKDLDSEVFTGKILLIMGVFLASFCVLAEIFMPLILKTIAPGFNIHQEYFAIGVNLARIMFPFLFLIGITAIFCCQLQAHHHFMPGSAYPIIMNIVLIAASFLPYMVVYNLAYGVILAGILQLIFLIGAMKFYKIPIVIPKIDRNFFDDDVKLFFVKLLPSILTMCVTRIGITIDTMIASSSVGAVSFIYYADRLYQLPLSLIGTTIATVLLPGLSKALVTHNKDKIYKIQNKVFEFTLILVLPATLGLSIMSYDICGLLFGSQFQLNNLQQTSLFLSLIVLALPFNVFNNILNSIFFSNHITKIATKISIYTLIINVISNIILFKYIGFLSVAIATIISSIFNSIFLIIYAYKFKLISLSGELLKKSLKILALNVLIALLLLVPLAFVQEFSYLWYIVIPLKIILTVVFYFGILYFCYNYKLSYFKKLFID